MSTLREIEAQTKKYNFSTPYSVLNPQDLTLQNFKSIIRENIKEGSFRGFDIVLPAPEAEIIFLPNNLHAIGKTPDKKTKGKLIHDLAETMQSAQEVIIFSHFDVSRDTRLNPSVDFTTMQKLEAKQLTSLS